MDIKIRDVKPPAPPQVSVAVAVDTQWGVLHSAHTAGRIVDVQDDEAAARSWLASLKFCGNNDAVLVAKVAGDPKAAWIPQGGAA